VARRTGPRLIRASEIDEAEGRGGCRGGPFESAADHPPYRLRGHVLARRTGGDPGEWQRLGHGHDTNGGRGYQVPPPTMVRLTLPFAALVYR
jgi:hypothetical protein